MFKHATAYAAKQIALQTTRQLYMQELEASGVGDVLADLLQHAVPLSNGGGGIISYGCKERGCIQLDMEKGVYKYIGQRDAQQSHSIAGPAKIDWLRLTGLNGTLIQNMRSAAEGEPNDTVIVEIALPTPIALDNLKTAYTQHLTNKLHNSPEYKDAAPHARTQLQREWVDGFVAKAFSSRGR